MKKTIIFIVIFALLFSVLLVLTNDEVVDKNNKEVIVDHIKEEGFEYDEDSDCYKKNIADNTLDNYYKSVADNKKTSYEELYFYLNQQRLNLKTEEYENVYYLNKVKMDYENNINRSYSSDYNLVDESISYKYEVSIYSSSIILSGTYDKDSDKFTCEVVSNKDMEQSDTDTFCVRAEYETNLFLQQVNDLIDNPDFVDAIYSR